MSLPGVERLTIEEILEALEKAKELADKLKELEGDEWMNAQEAAAYLSIKPDHFRKLAAGGMIKRHPLTGDRSGYRYYKPELREWGLAREEADG